VTFECFEGRDAVWGRPTWALRNLVLDGDKAHVSSGNFVWFRLGSDPDDCKGEVSCNGVCAATMPPFAYLLWTLTVQL